MTAVANVSARPPASAISRRAESRADFWGPLLLVLTLGAWAAGAVLGFKTSLAVLTVIGFAAAVVGVFNPTLGLLGIGILSTIDAPTRHFIMTGGLWRWNTFNYWLLVVIGLSVPFLWRLSDPHTRLLRLLLLLLSLELIVSPNLSSGQQHLLNVVTVLGLLVYFAPASQNDALWYWLGMMCGSLGAAGGLLYYVQRDELPWINANAWALFPITALFGICLGFPAAAERKRGQLIFALLATTNFVWVFLSASRGNLLIATCCALLLILAVRGVRRRAVVLAAAALIVFWIPAQFTDLQDRALFRIEKLFNSSQSLAKRTSGRSDLVLGGWYIFVDHPLGVGTGGFGSAWANLGRREGLSGFARGVEIPSHSAWMKILAENGIPGIILLVSYVFSYAVVGWRSGDRQLLFLGSLVTVTFCVAWISTEFSSKGLWFLAAGATTMLHRRRIAALLRVGEE